MFRKTAAALGALVALCFGAGHAGAAPVSPWTSFVVFGDSLSDSGNLFAANGGTTPASPPYASGRFSNGPVWAESIAGDFAAAGLLSANFAFGGALAVTNADSIPDLPFQMALFGASVPPAALGSRPLASLWFGANDLFAAIGTLPLAAVQATGAARPRRWWTGSSSLRSRGIDDFLVFNLPDLGRLPAYALLDPSHVADATAGSDSFNAALDLGIDGLRAAGLNVIEIDAAALFGQLQADPASFGVASAAVPCVIPGVSVCSAAAADQLAFFDPVHPTTKIHTVISGVVNAAIAPVPEPASALLLLAGLAALAGLRARAVRRPGPATCP